MENNSYLHIVPKRNADHEEDDEGHCVLLRPKHLTGVLAKLLQPKLPKKYSRIRLDDIGTTVWKLVDGDLTVGQIADLLHDQMGDRVEPRYERVSQFVHSLYGNGLLTLFEPSGTRKD
jgi:hypothetical protein